MARPFSTTAFLILAACGADTGANPPDPQPATLTVAVGKPVIEMGTTTVAGAVVRDQNGVLLPSYPVTWSTADPSVASIDANGQVTAGRPGAVAIIATAAGLTGYSSVTVVSPPVRAIELSVDSHLLLRTGAAPSLMTLRNLPAWLSPSMLTWSSSNPGVTAVGAAGQLTLVGPGVTTIAAEYAGTRGTMTITVPTPDLVQIVSASRAKVNDPLEQYAVATVAGTEIAIPPIWTVTDPTAASIAASGRLTAHRPGQLTVRATIGGVSATHALMAYDWTVTTDATGTTAVLPLQDGDPSLLIDLQYPNFTVSCIAGVLAARINVPYTGPSSVPVAINPTWWEATWVEDFVGGTNTLSHGGTTNAAVRTFLQNLAYISQNVFYYASSTVGGYLDFRVAGLQQLLQQEFAACS